MNDKEGDYIPTNSSENIKLTYLFDMINEATVIIPATQIRKIRVGAEYENY